MILPILEMDNLKDNESPGTSSNWEESGRGCRNKRKLSEPICCPVCSVTIRLSEIESHLGAEVDKLAKLSKQKTLSKTGSPGSASQSSDDKADKNWETYQRVRSNRHSRQRSKTKKRKADEMVCPVCNKETSEEITFHVEKCLRRSENGGSEESDENIDVEAYEEYEWAGQSRVRTTSMLSGGVSSLGTPLASTDEDEDLNVDGDEVQAYGSPQYTEKDIILPCGDPESVALRKAVTGSDPKKPLQETDENFTAESEGDPLLVVLKNRIKELENREQNKEEIYKCLICMERYRTPVISVGCWHVHCEQCWLQTLGAKKLCPQCNMITSPTDLRKIYM